MPEKYESISAEVAVPLVTISAPATLDEGFTFEADYDGVSFIVTVPKGGVVKGQQFEVPFDQSLSKASPYGKWKDHICNCCSFGPLHPSFLSAWCFPLILLGQVMTRLELSIWGTPGSTEQVRKTFKYILYIWICSVVLGLIFSPGVTEDGEDTENPIYGLYGLFMFFVFLILMIRTRRAIREKYKIPDESCCGVSNDICCSFWCGCCTVSQMARQTADYESSPALFFSATGIQKPPPLMIV